MAHIESNVAEVSRLVHVQNYIGGQFEDTDNCIDSFEPTVGKVWATVPKSNAATVDKAVICAKNAFTSWSLLGVGVRANYLMKIADLLEKRLKEFAIAEAKDQGKPVGLAMKLDIPRAVLNLRAFAEGQKHLLESSKTVDGDGVLSYTIRYPLGVAGLIVPWNLPLYLLTFKIAPALMAGNTVVCKPSEMTSVTAWMFCKLCEEVELPKGVINLVCGYGNEVGEALVRHPDVKVISFTGSTAVGRHISQIAAPMMKRLSLELGGKNAAIVFNDANLKQAVSTLIRASFLNQGEICLCTSRIYVDASVYDVFLKHFVDATKQLKIGRGKNVFLGALISKTHLEKVHKYIKTAVAEGGLIHCGETVNNEVLLVDDEGGNDANSIGAMSRGYFMAPTVITDLQDTSVCMREEIFGPVVCISKFSGTEDEVVRRANDVPYGLCASIWSENVGRIHRVASKLHVGTVWQNCWLIRDLDMPFGGCKDSGTGREGIYHSIETFTDVKTVCLKM